MSKRMSINVTKQVLLLITITIVLFSSQSYGKVYTKCGLIQELIKKNFSRSFIGNWVCMIESESFKDTSKITNKGNGSKSLGLFQINSKEWCLFNQKGGKCNMRCEDLLNENIDDDSACAKKVFEAHGFQYWDGWKRSCYLRKLPLPPC